MYRYMSFYIVMIQRVLKQYTRVAQPIIHGRLEINIVFLSTDQM